MSVPISSPPDDLEKLAHDNPLYAWRALAEDYPPGTPLPLWLHQDLHEFACRLMDLVEHTDIGPEGVVTALRLPAGKAAHQVPQVLKLTSPGQNKIEEFRQNRRNAGVAFLHDEESKPLPTETLDLARAHGISLPERHLPVPIKVLARAYGFSESAIREWIEKAKALWARQR